MKECEHNVALHVEPGDGGDEFVVSGRGMLHLGILIETMRREGYELSIGKPHVVIKEIDGKLHEPMENLVVDVPTESMGPVMELTGQRKGEMTHMEPRGTNRTIIEFEIPARGLIGLRARVLTATQGEAIMHHAFDRFVPMLGEVPGRQNGAMISLETGTVTDYSLDAMSDRGVMFVRNADQVYAGQVVGEHNRDNDLTINITRPKHLTNFREANKEAFTRIKAPRDFSLEQCLEYIEEDELVEVTPNSIRMRKRMLSEAERRRSARSSRHSEQDRAAAAAARS
jgi:GTP-binding protein